jgi:hypothetical protein
MWQPGLVSSARELLPRVIARRNLAAGPEQNRHCRILKPRDVKTEGEDPSEVEMRRPTRVPLDRMKFSR